MFRRASTSRDKLADLERVEAWTRARFGLHPDAVVIVTESPARQPGYPPLETTVLFWIGGERYRFTVFKPVAEVVEGDVPIAWLLPSLLDDGEAGCC